MRNTKKALIALAAAATILSATTGCSAAPATPAQNVPVQSIPAQPVSTVPAAKIPVADVKPAGAVTEALLHPSQWPALAHGTLCDYTKALIRNADRDGNAIPDKTRAAADRILAHC